MAELLGASGVGWPPRLPRRGAPTAPRPAAPATARRPPRCAAEPAERPAGSAEASSSATAAVSRRAAGLAAAAALAAPGAARGAAATPAPPPGAVREAKLVLRVAALRGSVPAQWATDFSTAMEGYGVAAITQRPTLADVWRDLGGAPPAGRPPPRRPPPAPTTADAVTLGDAWLQRAIAERLLQPIPKAETSRWFARLPERWRALVRRGPDGRPCGPRAPGAAVWASPYRWGATLIAYRSDRLRRIGGPVLDWDDLLRPALRGRVAFVDAPRELVGAALKSLGAGYNAGPAGLARCGLTEADLAARVSALARQVRVFSSQDHVRAFAAGEVDVAVGWSDDLIALAARQASVALAAPASGTALWADTWAVPRRAAGGGAPGEPSPLLPAWCELALAPARAAPARGLRGGASPLLLPPSAEASACAAVRPPAGAPLPPGALPPAGVLARSEFLLPLGAAAEAMHRAALGL